MNYKIQTEKGLTKYEIINICLAAYISLLSKYFWEKSLRLLIENENAKPTSYNFDLSGTDTFNEVLRAIEKKPVQSLEIDAKSQKKTTSFGFSCGESNIVKQFSKKLHFKIISNDDRYEVFLDKNEYLSKYFNFFFNLLVKNPFHSINDLHFIDQVEIQKTLINSNSASINYSKDYTALNLILEQAVATPEKIAVVFDERRVSYGELLREANKVKTSLLKRGVKTEQLVGIYLEQSIEFIISILGTLMAGAAYIPFDSEYTSERLIEIIKCSGINLLICAQQTKTAFIPKTVEEILVEEILNEESISSQIIPVKPANLAYVMFTSGSTGKSKGVMIEHKGVINQSYVVRHRYCLDGNSKVILHASPSFDSYVSKLFPVLSFGGTLFLIRKIDFLNIDYLRKIVNMEGITHLSCPPSMVSLLNEAPAGFEKLRYIGAGGEILKYKQINNLLGKVKIFNVYGPTEITVSATSFQVDPSADYDNTVIPIGKPNPNYSVYLLDTRQRVVPVGCPGELFVGGVGVGRGYLNDWELTEEKFVTNPFTGKGRLYKTGDIGMWDVDGNIIFLGRLDFQVKINGFRVELEEVEEVLSRYPGIKDASVFFKKGEEGFEYKAFIVLSEKEISYEKLMVFLKRCIPAYMIPNKFFIITKMPLTINGKVDKNSLNLVPFVELKHETIRITNEIELRIQSIINQKTGILIKDVSDNLFIMGVNSLKLFGIITAVEREFNVKIELKSLLKEISIKKISTIITNNLN